MTHKILFFNSDMNLKLLNKNGCQIGIPKSRLGLEKKASKNDAWSQDNRKFSYFLSIILSVKI